jgi:hypothetical protein
LKIAFLLTAESARCPGWLFELHPPFDLFQIGTSDFGVVLFFDRCVIGRRLDLRTYNDSKQRKITYTRLYRDRKNPGQFVYCSK